MKSGLIDQEGGGGDLARDMYDQQLSVSMAGLPGGLSASITAQIARSMGVDEKEALAGLQQPIGGVERGGYASMSNQQLFERDLGQAVLSEIALYEQDSLASLQAALQQLGR